MLSYEVYGRLEVYQSLDSLPERDRQRILNFIDRLASDPFHEGDHSERDQSGRWIQIKTFGKYAVFYWPDHAAKEIRVIDVVDFDQV